MRTPLVALAGAITLALLGGLSAAVLAQKDAETPSATYVTGNAGSGFAAAGVGCCGAPPGDSVGNDAVWEMEWSDPRLPSRMLLRHHREGGPSTHPDGVAMAMQMASAVRLEGPDGDWVGTGWALAWMWGSEAEHEEEWVELLALEGEGAYEGLSATLTSTGHGGVPGPYEGFIFEGDLPKWPDPPEPTAE